MKLNVTIPNGQFNRKYIEIDLDLIDVLWQQDVDLGLGKEVFDKTLRQELEREREQEIKKQHDEQKSQLFVKEKEEREKQEQADRWLKENFRRDGETGEWVRLQNGTENVALNFEANNDFLTLEAALEYISSTVDQSFVENLESCTGTSLNTCINTLEKQHDREIETNLTQQQVNVEDNWNGFLEYLGNVADDLVNHTDKLETSESFNTEEAELQNNYLIKNVTLVSPQNELDVNSSLNYDLSGLNFINPLEIHNNHNLSVTGIDDFLIHLPENHNSLLNTVTPFTDNMDNSFQELNDNLHQEIQVSLNQSSAGDNLSFYHDFSNGFDGLEGAIGGSVFTLGQDLMEHGQSKVQHLSESSRDSGFAMHDGFSSSSSSSSVGSPSGFYGGNISTSSNDTELDPCGTYTVAPQLVAHNHTYNTLPGHVPREVKKYLPKEPLRKGPQSRDQRRAEELKVPFSIEEIIESPVEQFNEMMLSHKLDESQLTLIRDIRRRGKNKVAAQNCRKRKVNVIVSLADEMTDLQRARDKLIAERAEMERDTRKMKDKFSKLYTNIFQSLRNEQGEPYDPNLFSLQQSSDGNVFLVPRNLSISKKCNSASTTDLVNSKKRKAYEDC
ncbi:endoplasmic reticulum membrane sensor NFE2L1-like isoform X2 [Physella acuta]|uniref:endoplasmic reticulum membrane sensor NFE2L1-like isoform X2 n=1 Tax=Physella acuta TaxID=109671 RepID=UPI0027DCCDAD|nr:endoplasmic reticulum membrane sensor NFE2L1-like isoform X2 [Physella acuta]